jgi:penicillin amidase
MRRFKKFLLVLVVLIVVLGIGLCAYIFHLKPKYEGEIELKNLQKETTVYFDEYGVPHIYADSEKDAMTALGYVHAQERLWQMELLRRIAPGKLSEIFGSVALKNDKFFAGIGIEEASAKAIAKLDKNSESYKLTQAYLDGINQYLDEGTTPVEFTLVGVKKEKFTIKDVYNIFGYMSFSFAMAQKTDPLLTDIRNKYGVEYLKDLGIEGEFNNTQIKSSKENIEDYTEVSKSITALLDKSPIPPFIGSNSWVAGPHKTKN